MILNVVPMPKAFSMQIMYCGITTNKYLTKLTIYLRFFPLCSKITKTILRLPQYHKNNKCKWNIEQKYVVNRITIFKTKFFVLRPCLCIQGHYAHLKLVVPNCTSCSCGVLVWNLPHKFYISVSSIQHITDSFHFISLHFEKRHT